MAAHRSHQLGGANGGEPVTRIARLEPGIYGMRLRMALFPGKEESLSQQKFAALRPAIIGFQEFPAAAQLIQQRIVVKMQSWIGGPAGQRPFQDNPPLSKNVRNPEPF